MTTGGTSESRPNAGPGGNDDGTDQEHTLSIMLVDDHDVMRRGLRSLIEAHPGWRVTCEAATGREALTLLESCAPDVIVTDLGLPEMNGLAAVRRMRQEAPAAEVIIFSIYETEFLVREAIAAGARGYILKTDAARHLTAAIESAAMHQPYFSMAITDKMRDFLVRDSDVQAELVAPSPSLTNREQEIIQLLAEGKTNKEIAVALSISPKTVETHRSAIMRKLGLKSIADLVRYAMRNGILYS